MPRKPSDHMLAVLRDFVRSGGRDEIAHLRSHGHRTVSIFACRDRALIRSTGIGRYEITQAGTVAVLTAEARRQNAAHSQQ